MLYSAWTFTYQTGRSNFSKVINPDNQKTFSWSLTNIIDTNNNEIYFCYLPPELNNNQIYPEWIEYTHHGNEVTTMRRIIFELEDRYDRFINCRAGFSIKTAKRLKSVTTKVGNDIVTIYKLSYVTNEAGASLLSKIQQYGPDNISNLQPAVFTYRTPQTSMFPWTFGPEIT